MKIAPCIKCGSKEIELYDCGYSSFNCGGGKCKSCGHKVSDCYLGCFPTQQELASIWNGKNDAKLLLARLAKQKKDIEKQIKRLNP